MVGEYYIPYLLYLLALLPHIIILLAPPQKNTPKHAKLYATCILALPLSPASPLCIDCPRLFVETDVRADFVRRKRAEGPLTDADHLFLACISDTRRRRGGVGGGICKSPLYRAAAETLCVQNTTHTHNVAILTYAPFFGGLF